MKHEREFYLQDTFEVARSLLGSYLYTYNNDGLTGGMIVETEAYIGTIDKASHSYNGKRTNRTEVQFNIGGYAYIYFVYGKYHQFCVVTGREGVSDVVLVRSLEPIEGISIMESRRNIVDITQLTNGPGKLCKSLGIDMRLYGEDLCGEKIWISPRINDINKKLIIASKRIGIGYAEEYVYKDWRYYIDGNIYVSRK